MTPPEEKIGLCTRCRHSQAVKSHRGPAYFLCRLAATNNHFLKYPYIPVIKCAGFEEKDDATDE